MLHTISIQANPLVSATPNINNIGPNASWCVNCCTISRPTERCPSSRTDSLFGKAFTACGVYYPQMYCLEHQKMRLLMSPTICHQTIVSFCAVCFSCFHWFGCGFGGRETEANETHSFPVEHQNARTVDIELTN